MVMRRDFNKFVSDHHLDIHANGLLSTRTFTNSYRVNSYIFIGQLVLFLQLVLWSTRTVFFGQLVLFSLVNSYFF